MENPTRHRHSQPTWRGARRAIAPIPFGSQLLGVWSLMLAGGTLAAILNLRWWLGMLLLVPGLVLQVRLGRRIAERNGVHERVFSIAENIVPGFLGAALAAVAAIDKRYFALVLVAGVILVVDPVARWQWRRRYGVQR